MSKLYKKIHGDDDPVMAINYKKLKGKKQQYLRSLFFQGVISKDTYEELMDIIHQGSMSELEQINLPHIKYDKDIVEKVKAIIEPKEVPKRKVWNAGMRIRIDNSLDHLDRSEKYERSTWITKTQRLYDRLIKYQACTVKEKEDFEANVHLITTPIEAERIFLNLYLGHHDKYDTAMSSTYCAKCPHCAELKNLMTKAFQADVDDLEKREKEE